MTEKRFERIYGDVDVFCRDHNAKGISQLIEKEDYDKIVDLLNELYDENEQLKHDASVLVQSNKDYRIENEQLKQQIKIFEKFLEANDLDIDWVEFCGVDECAFENPDFSCQECIHLKGDVN